VPFTPDLAEIQTLLAGYRWHGEVIASTASLPEYPLPIRGERYFLVNLNQFVECRTDRKWEGGEYTTPTIGSVYANRDDGTTLILAASGWQPYEEFLTALGGELGGSGGGDAHYALTGKENVSFVDGTVVGGQIAVDGSRFADIVLKYVVIAAVTAAVTGTVQLYNVTDTEVVETATVTATSPTKHEFTLTLGAAAGNVKLVDKIYEVRVSVTGSTAADIVFVGQAYLRAEVTA